MSDRRIHLLQIVGNAIVGGMETFVLRLLQRLPRERYRVSCLCPNESRFTRELRETGAEVMITPMPEEPGWRAIQLGATLARAEGVQLIHAHLANAHVLAGLVGRLTGLPVLATVHSRDVTAADLEIHRLADTHLCVVSRTSYYQALAAGVRADRLHCIRNGVDPAVFAPRPRSGELQRELGLPEATPLVAFVGRLSGEKGPEVFVRVAAAAAAAEARAHYVFLGDGPLRERLRQDAASLGVEGRLHFAGVRDDMARDYASLDLVVSTSWTESLPLSLMEAMACGLPVIATQVGGVPELIVAGETGMLYTPGDSGGIARSVVDLLTRSDARAALGAAGRRRIEREFRLADRIDDLTALLSRLLRPEDDHLTLLAAAEPGGLRRRKLEGGAA